MEIVFAMYCGFDLQLPACVFQVRCLVLPGSLFVGGYYTLWVSLEDAVRFQTVKRSVIFHIER